MTGNLDIPEAGNWASPPSRAVADPAWRRPERRGFRWLLWLGGLAILSFAAAAALHLLGGQDRGAGEVPLIAADPTPVRVRPDDPGGLRIANLDKSVYDQLSRTRGAENAPRVESLLPPPEAPKPLPVAPPALAPQRAALTEGPTEREEARPAEQPAATPQPSRAAEPQAPIPPAPATPSATPPGAAPPTPAAPQAAAQPASPAPPPAGTGRIQVQLAAVPTDAAATAEWERLRRRMPDLLGNQRLSISRGERDGQPLFRVRTGAFEDNAQARAFCDQVRARGGSCFVVPGG